jgi:hypothetical protein
MIDFDISKKIGTLIESFVIGSKENGNINPHSTISLFNVKSDCEYSEQNQIIMRVMPWETCIVANAEHFVLDKKKYYDNCEEKLKKMEIPSNLLNYY